MEDTIEDLIAAYNEAVEEEQDAASRASGYAQELADRGVDTDADERCVPR